MTAFRLLPLITNIGTADLFFPQLLRRSLTKPKYWHGVGANEQIDSRSQDFRIVKLRRDDPVFRIIDKNLQDVMSGQYEVCELTGV